VAGSASEGFFALNSIKFYGLPPPANHPLRISDYGANRIEGLIQIPISMPSEQGDLGPDHRNAASTKTALEAAYQRKIATGWLYLVDITSDDLLRANYERIARHHTSNLPMRRKPTAGLLIARQSLVTADPSQGRHGNALSTLRSD
jgi:hypothetical protein